MFFSVSKAFERKRMELNLIADVHASLTSKETIHCSEQLDHFVNLYQNQKQSEMSIIEKIEGTKLTIEIKGQLDIVTSENLASYIEVNKVNWSKTQELYINLVDINFFDTSGIYSLISLILEARKNNILIKTIKTSKSVFEVLNIMGIPKLLKRIHCGTFIAM